MDPRPPLTPKRSSTAPPHLSNAALSSDHSSTSQPNKRATLGPSQLRNQRSHLTTSTSLAGSQASPLEDAIDRLTAACEEHERAIRSSKSSIEHRLYNELPDILTKLNDVDDEAEAITAEIQASLSSIQDPLKRKLTNLVKARERDVETMRARTTPWASFFEEEEDSSGLGTGKIARITGTGVNGEDGDGLARIEKWAEEVEIYLSSEIIRLKAALGAKSRRRSLVSGLFSLLATVLVALIAIGWLASRRWG